MYCQATLTQVKRALTPSMGHITTGSIKNTFVVKFNDCHVLLMTISKKRIF